jgi:hypothetical protein
MYVIELDTVPYTWQIYYTCDFYILTSVNKINHSYIWLWCYVVMSSMGGTNVPTCI